MCLCQRVHSDNLCVYDLYLLCVWGGFQGAAVVLWVHHGHLGAAVVQHLLHAVDAAALAACADRGARDGVVASQAVHLTAGCLAILQQNIQTITFKNTNIYSRVSSNRYRLLQKSMFKEVTSIQGNIRIMLNCLLTLHLPVCVWVSFLCYWTSVSLRSIQIRWPLDCVYMIH